MSTERQVDLEEAIECAKRVRDLPFPKYYGAVPAWLIDLRDYLLDPRAVRIVEHVIEELRALIGSYEDSLGKVEDQFDQTECELEDMREKFGALLQQYDELCAKHGVEKGEHRSNGARP